MNYALTWYLRRHAAEHHLLEDLAAALATPAGRINADLAELARQGFQFEHHPTAGVRLVAGPVAIDRDEIALARAGRRIGHTVRVYEQTASTNDVAMTMARTGRRSDGMVVLAEQQAAGRGRQGAAWFGTRGESLLVSVICWLDAGRGTAGELMMAAGVAVGAAVEAAAGVKVGIKWPNDVEIKRRKVAGILVESSQPTVPGAGASGSQAAGSRQAGETAFVIGIGLNVNQQPGTFPAEIADRAGSLRMAAGRELDRVVVLERLLDAMDGTLQLLAEHRPEELLERYMARCDMIGRHVTLREGRAAFAGQVESISPHFALILRLEDGTQRAFDSVNVRLT